MADIRSLSTEIESDDYVRQRCAPLLGDPLYLVLSDLRLAMDRVRTDARLRVLDFGCGGSPYRELFPNADYLRADYISTSRLDYTIRDDSTIEEADETFDLILSTQVLEHVTDVDAYLSECMRLLKPGGRIVCTTHGTYEDHGCPYDFQRWTGDGLARLFTQKGFDNKQGYKITTGPRAVLFLLDMNRRAMVSEENGDFGALFNQLALTIHHNADAFHAWCDAAFAQNRLVEADKAGHPYYICLMLVAEKPSHSRSTARYEEILRYKQQLLGVPGGNGGRASIASAPLPPGAVEPRCPVTGLRGEMVCWREPEELAAAYGNYLGAPLPAPMIRKYFRSRTYEYECRESGIRWYTPGVVAEEDFYETLARIYPWYYREESWDKDLACRLLRSLSAGSFVEYGCGDGSFLRLAARSGIKGHGVDLSARAVHLCKAQGFDAFLFDEASRLPDVQADALVLLQTIEHLPDPVGFLRSLLKRIPARTLVLSAPCHEALLGHTRDPLSWPPHHFTSWSEKGFQSLAEKIGYRVLCTVSEPLTPERLEGMLAMEKSRKLRDLPEFPPGAACAELLAAKQAAGEKWALYSHSIICVMSL